MDKTFNTTTASNGTYIGVWWSDVKCHRDMRDLFELLRKRKWNIYADPKTAENFPSISKDYFQGELGDLFLKSSRYPAGFKIEFYQNVNTINKNGGEYDFDKLELMSYLMKKRCLLEIGFIKSFLVSRGYVDKSEPVIKNSFEKVMYKIKSCWHYEEGKELPEFDIPAYNSKDKYGKQIRNGQVKYFYGYKGVLMRGTVYHNINNMWWTILNKNEYTNIASFELFDLEDEPKFVRKKYSREIPQRIRAEKLRNRFNEKYNYKMINELHINQLLFLISNELAAQYDDEMRMTLKFPLKKDIKILKRDGLKCAKIEVNGSYFTGREAITFSSSGFIGFAGWASDRNVKPFVDAFEKWLDWLDSVIKVSEKP